MRTLRISFWSMVGAILCAAVAWSFSVLLFHVASMSATRAEMHLRANLNPIHIGYQNEAVSPVKPGIPLQANLSQKIAGRELSEWLQQSPETKGEIRDAEAFAAIAHNDARFRVGRLPDDPVASTFPALSQVPGHIIVLIAIPVDGSNSLSALPGTPTVRPVFENLRLEAIPAFGTWGSDK